MSNGMFHSHYIQLKKNPNTRSPNQGASPLRLQGSRKFQADSKRAADLANRSATLHTWIDR
jgi:hypothetical protein